MGTIEASKKVGPGVRMRIICPEQLLTGQSEGDSMAVNGACLTMLDLEDSAFSADVSAETLELTTLGALDKGSPVNLEPALALGDSLGGHLVSGHVDGLASLVERRSEGDYERFTFRVPGHLARYLATKGSVCLAGVSLTVNTVDSDQFSVCLIPHTLKETILGSLQSGDDVNFEADMIARYLESLLAARSSSS